MAADGPAHRHVDPRRWLGGPGRERRPAGRVRPDDAVAAPGRAARAPPLLGRGRGLLRIRRRPPDRAAAPGARGRPRAPRRRVHAHGHRARHRQPLQPRPGRRGGGDGGGVPNRVTETLYLRCAGAGPALPPPARGKRPGPPGPGRSLGRRGRPVRKHHHPCAVRRRRAARTGVHPRRRRLPGGALAAAHGAPGRAAVRPVPGIADAEPVALPVLLGAGRRAAHRVVAGGDGATGGRAGHGAPHRRHPAQGTGRRRGRGALRRPAGGPQGGAPST